MSPSSVNGSPHAWACLRFSTLRNAYDKRCGASRYGGEEFCFLLPDATLEQATAQAERPRTTISGLLLGAGGQPRRVTASFGVAERSGDDTSVAALLGRSDAALYEAKRRGRDRVVAASA